MQKSYLGISGLSDKPEITQGILFRKEFKIRSEAFAKSMGRTRVVRGRDCHWIEVKEHPQIIAIQSSGSLPPLTLLLDPGSWLDTGI